MSLIKCSLALVCITKLGELVMVTESQGQDVGRGAGKETRDREARFLLNLKAPLPPKSPVLGKPGYLVTLGEGQTAC